MDTKKYKLVKNELSNIEKDNVIYNWFRVKKNASITVSYTHLRAHET